jgi:hydroxyacylglutathione hydrolase
LQISPNLHALRVPFTIPVTPDQSLPRVVYVYVVLGDREVWLIDSGVAGTEALIETYLREIGREMDDVSTLVLTHSHPDHIGAAVAIQDATGCDVLVHEAEQAWLEDVELQRQQRPVPGFDTLVGGAARVTRTIDNGDRLALDSGLTLEVLHTPGHSAGSVSLWIESEGALITGDAVISPGDLPIYDDYRQCMASIERLAALEGVEVLLSSWDAPKQSEAVGQSFQEGLDYLARIDKIVRRTTNGLAKIDPTGLCRDVVGELGLPPVAVNPLVARALMSHLEDAGR